VEGSQRRTFTSSATAEGGKADDIERRRETMTRIIPVETGKYIRTHGCTPYGARPCRGMWAFLLDGQEQVRKYGTYREALTWAQAQATSSVEVLP
jgi:hypothetical protein